jgi:hypothetical protein
MLSPPTTYGLQNLQAPQLDETEGGGLQGGID